MDAVPANPASSAPPRFLAGLLREAGYPVGESVPSEADLLRYWEHQAPQVAPEAAHDQSDPVAAEGDKGRTDPRSNSAAAAGAYRAPGDQGQAFVSANTVLADALGGDPLGGEDAFPPTPSGSSAGSSDGGEGSKPATTTGQVQGQDSGPAPSPEGSSSSAAPPAAPSSSSGGISAQTLQSALAGSPSGQVPAGSALPPAVTAAIGSPPAPLPEPTILPAHGQTGTTVLTGSTLPVTALSPSPARTGSPAPAAAPANPSQQPPASSPATSAVKTPAAHRLYAPAPATTSTTATVLPAASASDTPAAGTPSAGLPTGGSGDTPACTGPALRLLSGFTANTLPANDDDSAGPVDLGFTANFGGTASTSVYINNDGNLTFTGPSSDYTPYPLGNSTQPLIAPFFADVDTRDGHAVTYGTATVDGHAALGVNWFDVTYYDATAASHVPTENCFQVVLIDRSDVQAGAFDIEFNYGGISWETGDASGGSGGLGGTSARAGYSNGTSDAGGTVELAGSGVNGAFLDSNTATGLIHNRLNSDVDGRYVFDLRESLPTWINASPTSPTLTEGTAPGPVTVATFTDDTSDPSRYTASIDWADGSPPSDGTVTYANGTFSVQGQHIYAEEGAYASTVTVFDTIDNDTASISSPVAVNDAALTSTGPSNLTLQLSTGTAFSGFLGSFQDANPNGSPSDVTTSIDWGDGTPAGPGTVTNCGTTLLVSGSHTYAADGTYSVLLNTIDVGGASATSHATALVSSTGLGGNPAMPVLTEGTAATVPVATFTDPSGNTDPTRYTALIDWGDGSAQTSGTVSYTGSSFLVEGSHTYAEEGTYPLSVSLSDTSDGATLTVTGMASVSDASLTPAAGSSLQATQGTAFSGTLASFTDANLNAPAADFTVVVDWGDGSTPTTAPVTATGPGQFTLNGSHVWNQGGALTVTVRIADKGGSQTTVSDSATVTPVTPPAGVSVTSGGANGVVISQVYSTGGQVGSAFVQDYVELFNQNATPVSLAGWSLQYADVGSGTWQVAPLAGQLLPGQYYLVGVQSGTAGQANAPAADVASSLTLAAAAGKLALVNVTTPLSGAGPSGPSLVDFVGYGAADAFEGAGSAPTTDPTTADVRLNGGFTETEQNDADFSADPAAPHNSVSPLANLPPVDTVPGSQTTAQDTPLIFSTANNNALSVSDVDAGINPVEVSLLADNGTLTLPTLAGLTLTDGTGSGDTTMTFTGTLDAINADLNGLRFDPTPGFVGAAVVGISINDLGNTGAGGPQTDALGVLVAVGGPLVAVDTQATTDENTPVEVDVLATDAFVHGDQLTLSLVSGPANGQAVVNSNGTPGYATISYTPSSYFSGTDSFVYQVSDGYGNSATATVTLTVNSVDYAFINVPPDQVDVEGNSVSLQLETPNNATGVPLTFTAVGLPAGLSIDPHTGMISGIPLYSDAETNAGQYSVTVTATGPGQGDSDTESFKWSIGDTNRIGLIDDQVSEAGQSVSLPPVVQDNLGDQLTFSATGLPAGLSIDPNTGRIYGTVAVESLGITTFAVTLQATGGGDTDSQTFNWSVVTGPSEYVFFAINDTLRTEDDVTLVDPQTPLPVRVTLFAPGTQGPQAVYLEVPSGLATLNTSELQLSDGQSAEVVLTPQQASVQADDVVLVAFNGPQLQQVIGQVQAVVEQKIIISTPKFDPAVNRIDAADTPSGMKDRIPPRDDTPYYIEFAGAVLPKNQKFTVTVEGGSKRNGMAALLAGQVGYSKELFIYPGKVNNFYKSFLSGTIQTVRGNEGNLMVAVFAGGGGNFANPLEKTAGFSVAAIPLAVQMSNPTIIKGIDGSPNPDEYAAIFGATYQITFLSDSSHPADLDQILLSEKVSGNGIGSLKGIQVTTSGFKSPAKQTIDINAQGRYVSVIDKKGQRLTEAAARVRSVQNFLNFFRVKGNGKTTVVQYVVFYDDRTGMTEREAVKVPQSGFTIIKELKKAADGTPAIFVTRTPEPNNGVLAGLMAGADTKTVEDKIQ